MWLRLMDWLDALPEWLQPAMVGALALAAMAAVRTVLLFPRIVAQPDTVLVALAAIGLSALAGAVAGLSYTLLGRPLRKIPGIGRYLAGIVCAAVYLFPLGLLISYASRGETTGVFPDPVFMVVLFGLSVFWGLIIGHWWFED